MPVTTTTQPAATTTTVPTGIEAVILRKHKMEQCYPYASGPPPEWRRCINTSDEGIAASVNKPSITLDEFDALQTGMSYDDATEIVGGPGTLSSESSLGGIDEKIYSWDGEGDGASADATFQNDSLIAKVQIGL